MRHPEYFDVFSVAESRYRQLGTEGPILKMCAIRWCKACGWSLLSPRSYGRNKVGHHGILSL